MKPDSCIPAILCLSACRIARWIRRSYRLNRKIWSENDDMPLQILEINLALRQNGRCRNAERASAKGDCNRIDGALSRRTANLYCASRHHAALRAATHCSNACSHMRPIDCQFRSNLDHDAVSGLVE